MNLHTTHPDSRAPGGPATGSPGERAKEQGAAPATTAGDVREASLYLEAQGFQPAEAGNLTAYVNGLAPVEGGWTVDEIARLLFVRHLVGRGLIES